MYKLRKKINDAETAMRSIVRRSVGWLMSLTLVAVAATSIFGFAQAQTLGPAAPKTGTPSSSLGEGSPWLVTPVFSVNPKLGVSVGVLGGYLHYFDEKSRPSIFALSGQVTNTDSTVAGAFARTSFAEDHHRLVAGFLYGYVKNDYSDYLGTGVPLKINTELLSFISRYLYRVKGDWFIGGQGIFQNVYTGGEAAFDDQVVDILGVKPYKSGGVGLVVNKDSRDSENMPTRGGFLNINNVAYRDWLGSQDNFDIYRVELRYFMGHGNGHVFAVRQLNNFTDNAPTQARAPVQLRGYKIGQYNANFMSSIEGEERLRLAEKWTATIFAGVAYLYGGGKSSSESADLYPAVGAGIQYILKPKEGIVLNLETAFGNYGNYGIYMKMGYAY